MNQFPEYDYRQDTLHVENVDIAALALQYGTPCYVYSKKHLHSQWSALCEAFSAVDFFPCYAVKANSNIAILQLLADWGAGFDIVSLGELERVLVAGGEPAKIMFSGVAKREDELRKAIHCRIGCINVESEFELQRIASIAADMEIPVNVSLRINPDVNPQTHPYIATGLKESKFGIASETALPLYQSLLNHAWVHPVGIDCHIGSQIVESQPYKDAAQHVFQLVAEIEALGIRLKHIDLGGGFGIDYTAEQALPFHEFANVLIPYFKDTDYQLVLEPGRSIVANAGALITSVEHIKETAAKNFALVDAAMNDLLRPALYDAWHSLLPVHKVSGRAEKTYDVVGPVCESGDFFARSRAMPELSAGDLLAVMSAGAYAMSMASNYNSRQRPCELLIDDDQIHLIRRRETLEELWSNEVTLC